jgi:hypothetical protein
MEFYRRVDFYVSVAAFFLVIVLAVYVFYQDYNYAQAHNELSSKFQNYVRLTEPITSTFTEPKEFVQALGGTLNDVRTIIEDINQSTYENFSKLNKNLEGGNVPPIDVEEIVETWNDNIRRRGRVKRKSRPSNRWDEHSEDEDAHKSYVNDAINRRRGRV